LGFLVDSAWLPAFTVVGSRFTDFAVHQFVGLITFVTFVSYVGFSAAGLRWFGPPATFGWFAFLRLVTFFVHYVIVLHLVVTTVYGLLVLWFGSGCRFFTHRTGLPSISIRC
jgi:hypothetical protein